MKKSEVSSQQSAKAQSFGPGDQPWETSDGILAFSLYLSGVQFLTTRNLYTAETFRALGFTGEVDLLEAAKQCVAARKKGNLKYLFQRPPKRLLEIFTDQERRLKEDNGDAMAALHALMESYAAKEIDLHEALTRISCLILKLRGNFLNHWRDQPPLVQIDNPGKPRTVATAGGMGKTTQFPGFRIVSANASDETKKQMGL
jgi:hypothetical protein